MTLKLAECVPAKGYEYRFPSGYRIPLPAGRYRIVLHFAEIYWGLPHALGGKRVFGVLAEGRPVLESYDPGAAGFATATTKDFEVEVRDGWLDIEFVPRVGDPKFAAIQIEPLER